MMWFRRFCGVESSGFAARAAPAPAPGVDADADAPDGVSREAGEEAEEGGMEMMAAQREGNGKVKLLLGQNVPVCPQQNILKTNPSLHLKNPAMLHTTIRHPRQPRPEQE